MSFAVDLGLLQAMVDQMARFEQRVAAVQADVAATMQRLHLGWQGAAAAESAQAHERWSAGAGEMHEAIGVLRSIAATAGANYASAIEANRSMWRP